MWSPIVAGTVLRPIDQPEDQYHVVPVKFFNVAVDKTQKYETFLKEVAWGDDKRPYGWQEVVRPRGESREVSKSDQVLIIG